MYNVCPAAGESRVRTHAWFSTVQQSPSGFRIQLPGGNGEGKREKGEGKREKGKGRREKGGGREGRRERREKGEGREGQGSVTEKLVTIQAAPVVMRVF